MAEQIGLSCLKKNWQFFVPPKGFKLITSDNPVVFSGVAPGNPNSEIIVNLRKDLTLVCTPQNTYRNNIVFESSSQEAKKFNRGIVQSARRFVFASFQSETMDSFVKKYQNEEQTIIF